MTPTIMTPPQNDVALPPIAGSHCLVVYLLQDFPTGKDVLHLSHATL